MLTITPIQNHKYQELRAKPQSRPAFNKKSGALGDAFERVSKPIAFKGNIFEFGVALERRARRLFAVTSKKIGEKVNSEKKYKLVSDCVASLISYRNAQLEKSQDIAPDVRSLRSVVLLHEMSGVLQVLLSENELCASAKRSNSKLFRNMSEATLEVIRKYNLFIQNGFYKNEMSPKSIFGFALDYANVFAKNKNVKIAVEGEDILSKHSKGLVLPRGRLDDSHVYTIFSNLMQNAAKYTREGSTVNVKIAEPVIDDKKYLTFSVRDEGIGIRTQKDWENALDGERAKNAVKSGIPGTGFGLRRARKLIERFQGQDDKILERNFPLHPESDEYPGTEIIAYLRLKD